MRLPGKADGIIDLHGYSLPDSSGRPVTHRRAGTGLRSRVWAEACNAAGQRAAAGLETGEGWRVAAVCALELQLHERRLGSHTGTGFDADPALLVPCTRIQEL